MNTLEILKSLVQIPSVNPMGRSDLPTGILYEGRLAQFIRDQFQLLGIKHSCKEVAENRFNVIASYSPPTHARHILLQAHLDTVPVDGMSIDPFGAVVKDGKLYGRGACDVKAGLAAMLAAFLRICEDQTRHSAKVSVAFTVDEEHMFLGVQELVKDELDVDFAVIAEPTKLNIVTAHKGVARWIVETAGRACHSSKPHQGENAVYRMARVVAAIESYARELPTTRSDMLLGSPSLSVGVIAGGVSANTVPDACRIEIDRRLIPGESAESALKDFEAMIAKQRFDFEVKTTLTFACPPLHAVSDENKELHRLKSSIDMVAGSHQCEAVPYATDASILAAAGVPCVVFGPGDIAQAHTHDEWVDLAEVEKAAEILYRFAITT